MNINETKQLGTQIRLLRKAAQMSETDLARISDLSRTAIQSIESGKKNCQLDTLFKIMAALNIKFSIDHPLLEKLNENTSD